MTEPTDLPGEAEELAIANGLGEPDRLVYLSRSMYERGFDLEVIAETPSGELVCRVSEKASAAEPSYSPEEP